MPKPASASPDKPATTADAEYPHRYTAALAAEIESRWQQTWQQQQTFATANPVFQPLFK